MYDGILTRQLGIPTQELNAGTWGGGEEVEPGALGYPRMRLSSSFLGKLPGQTKLHGQPHGGHQGTDAREL